MHLIVCIDDRMGMTFGGRRQSRDRLLCEDVVRTVRQRGRLLYMPPYSAPLFEGMAADILRVSDTYLTDAGVDDFCFCEREKPSSVLGSIGTLTVYHWNRHYPSDCKLDVDLSRYQRIELSEFAGSSHEKITKEIYQL
jgi:hypothetical protein